MTRTGLCVFWFFLASLWLVSLPIRPLYDPDEGRYAEIPREMTENGNWVTPTLNGLKYFEKPPLQYWATATLYTVFGVGEWSARLWAASLALLCIPLVYSFSRQIGYSRDTALVAAMVLAISPYFSITGQLNLLDQGFTFFLSAAVFSFVLAQRDHLRPRRSRNWMLVTWVMLALAVLSKGLVALVLAGGTLVAYAAASRDIGLFKRLQLTLGLPLFFLLTVPWFWIVQSRNPEFFGFFFVREHFQRFLTTVHDRVEPIWFFVPIIAISILPLMGNWRSWRKAQLDSGTAPGQFHSDLFLLLWCAVVLVFFSLSQSKLASYVMPMIPAMSVVLGRITAADPKAFSKAKWISIAFLCLLAVGLALAGYTRSGSVPEGSLLLVVLIIGGGIAYLFADRAMRSRRPSLRWMALAAASVAGYQVLSLSYNAAFPTRSAKEIASVARFDSGESPRIYSVGQYRHSLAFYLRRPLEIYDYSGEFEFGMRQAGLTPGERDRRSFLERWKSETSAIAFIDRRSYAALSSSGIPGRVIAQDARTVVMARS